MSKLHPEIGELIRPLYSCNLWDESLNEVVDKVHCGEILLVLVEKKIELWRSPDYYRRVLSPRGVAGWIYRDNCAEF